MQIAIYGKGGIGKSTIAANISAALAASGQRVLQVGCDPKHDSTRLLLRGQTPPTVLAYIRDTPPGQYRAEDIVLTGEFGVDCAEAGGPEPGIGCAGRGILSTFELLDTLGIRQRGYDAIIYDVLGDVVCGGFAVPIRNEYSDRVYIVTSGEFMSLYAANNILRGLLNYQTGTPRVGGLIFNSRGGDFEAERVARFAQAVGLPLVAALPRSNAFAECERAGRTLQALGPGSELSQKFGDLARTVLTGSLYPARPLTDDELEERVLGDSRPASQVKDQKPSVEKAPELTAAPASAVAAGAVSAPMPAVAASAPAPALPADAPQAAASAPAAIAPAAAPDSTSGPAPAAAPAPATAATAQPLLSKALTFKEPLHGCAFSGALSITIQLGDCVSVAHGPRSCAHIAFQAFTSRSRRMLLERGIVLPMQTAPPVVSTDMNESVMVFGGGVALGERIAALLAQRPAPPAVFVVSTCPSGIIGEDIAATAALSTAATQVIPVNADGNLNGDHLQGIFLGYQAIAQALIDRQAVPEPDLVNIVAEKTIADATTMGFQTIQDILARLGLRVNCRFICESSYDQVRGFLKAPLNLLANGDYMGRALQDYLQQEFGARFFDRPFPVGFAESQSWVRALAEQYGRAQEAEEIIADYRLLYESEVARLRPLLQGRRLMVVTFNHDIDWILSTALDLGIELSFVGILDYSQDCLFRTAYRDAIVELETEIDYSAEARAADIGRIRPDILLGNYLPAGEIDVPVSDTIPFCPTPGFLAGVELAARWADLRRMDLKEGWRKDADLYSQYGS